MLSKTFETNSGVLGAPIPGTGSAATRYGPTEVPTAQDMVANLFVPKLGRLAGGFDIDKLPATHIKLKPRDGVTTEWDHEFNDLIAACHLSGLLKEKHPYSRQRIYDLAVEHGYRLTDQEVTVFHGRMMQEWWTENTKLYYLAYRSICLEGPYKQLDLQMIQRAYWVGEMRDGIGLLEWVRSFQDSESIASQASLIRKVQSKKLAANATIEMLTLHCTELLQEWQKITGNHIGSPGSYYFHLLESIPDGQDNSKLGIVRSWFAGLMADNSPVLADPHTFNQMLISRARTLGLSSGGVP